MKKNVQEYLTYYSPEFIYIPYDELSLLKLRKDKKILYNTNIGLLNNGDSIFSPVSGKIIGTRKSKFLSGEKNSLVIENDFIDRREKLNPFIEISNIKKSDINKILESYGLYQKINSKIILVVESKYDKKIDLGDMVINYESYEEILEAIDELLDLYHIKTCYICIPKEDYISETAFNKYINAFPNMCIVHSKRKFKDSKCVFYSIEDVLAVFRAIHLNYLLDNTMITITKEDTTIVKVKIYTALTEILKALKITYKGMKIYANGILVDDVVNFVIDKNIRTITIK